MDSEAQELYNRAVLEFNKMDSTKQNEMITLVKNKLKSHYKSINIIGLGYANRYVDASEKFLEKFDKNN